MSHPISLFGHYKKKEDAVTNYVGVILRMVYQHSPQDFEAMLNTWLQATPSLEVGPRFIQQKNTGSSIPDLLLEQSGFTVRFETKLGAAFPPDQLRRHLTGFEGTGVRMLVALGQQEEEAFLAEHRDLVQEAQKNGIQLVSLSFDELIESLRAVKTPGSFDELLEEFAAYLDAHGLLPRWKNRLTVVNVAGTMDEFTKGLYVSPDTGGSYSHQRALYFGAYKDKRVCYVAEVQARIRFESGLKNPMVDWSEGISPEQRESLIKTAVNLVANCAPWRQEEAQKNPMQVMLLGEAHETSFLKRSPGGLFGTKIYFGDLVKVVGATNAQELAEKLKGQTWAAFGR